MKHIDYYYGFLYHVYLLKKIYLYILLKIRFILIKNILCKVFGIDIICNLIFNKVEKILIGIWSVLKLYQRIEYGRHF